MCLFYLLLLDVFLDLIFECTTGSPIGVILLHQIKDLNQGQASYPAERGSETRITSFSSTSG